MTKLAPTHAAILLPVLALAAIPVHAQPRLSTQDATAPQPAAIDVLAPVLAGVLVTVTGTAAFEPLVACVIAVWLVASTLRVVGASHEELLWPERAGC